MYKRFRTVLIITFLLPTLLSPLSAQFLDSFNGSDSPKGWVSATGDGEATIAFKQKNGIASLYVDATKDKLNISIKPLGAVNASFYSRESPRCAPTLYVDVE